MRSLLNSLRGSATHHAVSGRASGSVRVLLVCAALSGCGDDEPRARGGLDASVDAGADDAGTAVDPRDAGEDGGAPRDAGRDEDAEVAIDAGSEDAGGDAGVDAGPDEPAYDCENLPAGPVPYTIIEGPQAAEDFTFDRHGNLWSVDASGNVTTTAFGEQPKLRIPGIASGFVSGTRLLTDGNLIVNDSEKNQVVHLTPVGGRTNLASGLSYPNGLAIGMDGWAYAAEQNAGRVIRVHPTTKAVEVVAEGIENANGLSFSPDYKTLYVGSFGGGTIMKVPVLEDGTFGPPEGWAEDIGGGALDGMGVDACGNVYVCEYVAAVVWRISSDGQTKTPLVDLSKHTGWIPNMNWGAGEGWKKNVLYVSDRHVDELFAVEVGVPGKPEPHLQ